MDVSSFIQVIHTTPLLVPSEKDYFTQKAPTYTPEVRRKMFHILRHHEDHLLQVTHEHLISMQEDVSKKLKEQFEQIEKEHEAEVAKAESDLMKDLESV